MHLRPLARAAATATITALLLTACGSTAPATRTTEAAPGASPSASPVAAPAKDRGYTVVSAATIRVGDKIPRPTGKVVLTLTGVSNPNVGNTVQFDLATLDALGTVRYTVLDRQALGRDVSFSGPLLRTVLAVAGAKGTVLRCTALNDYTVKVPAADATRFPVLLATRADGRRMSVATYGPTRFIYPTRGYHLDKTVYDPRWIWQLSRISVG